MAKKINIYHFSRSKFLFFYFLILVLLGIGFFLKSMTFLYIIISIGIGCILFLEIIIYFEKIKLGNTDLTIESGILSRKRSKIHYTNINQVYPFTSVR